MKSKMNLLKSKVLLYALTILSLMSLLKYLYTEDMKSVTFFIVVGYLTTFFSKNMIIVLTTAIISTNLLMNRSVYEGMKEGHSFSVGSRVVHELGAGEVTAVDDKEGTYSVKFDDEKTDDAEGVPGSELSAEEEGEGEEEGDAEEGEGEEKTEEEGEEEEVEETFATRENLIDRGATLKQNLKHLEGMIGKGGMKGLAKETKELMATQKTMMSALEGMAPLMGQMGGMMKQLDKVGGSLEGLNLPGFNVDKKKKN